MSDGDARIQELEARLAEFSAALGRERAERERAAHERDQYKKLYELVALELERVKRHLRAQNKSERVDAQQVQLAFAEVAKLVVPPELAQAIADQENDQCCNAPAYGQAVVATGRFEAASAQDSQEPGSSGWALDDVSLCLPQ